jgi:hypothetical protein
VGQEVAVLKAGWCAVDITPPVGTPLAGFAARKGVSEGIHDPLMARALVVEREGGETVALLTVDVVGVPTPMARQVRERIAAAIGIGRPRDPGVSHALGRWSTAWTRSGSRASVTATGNDRGGGSRRAPARSAEPPR